MSNTEKNTVEMEKVKIFSEKVTKVKQELKKDVVGKTEIIENIIIAIIAVCTKRAFFPTTFFVGDGNGMQFSLSLSLSIYLTYPLFYHQNTSIFSISLTVILISTILQAHASFDKG